MSDLPECCDKCGAVITTTEQKGLTAAEQEIARLTECTFRDQVLFDKKDAEIERLRDCLIIAMGLIEPLIESDSEFKSSWDVAATEFIAALKETQ